MARQGVWSVGTVEITGDEDEQGVAVLVVDEDEGGLLANDLWTDPNEGDAVRSSLTQLFGEIGRPRKIVVKNGALAKALRASGVREDIIVGGTPQLDAVMEALDRDVAELANMPGPLDGDGATSAHMNAFYLAAEAMRLAAPWDLFPPATGFVVEAPALGIEQGGAFIVSGADELEEQESELADELPGGFMFVESPEDFEGMSDALTGNGGRDRASAIALSYERAEDLGPSFAAFVREHGLEVPAEGWVPMLMRTKREVGIVPLTGSDYELATAICTAIVNITTAIGHDENEELDAMRAELVTQSGLEIAIEGPMEDEGDEE